MGINLQYMKVRLVTAVLCIPVFFLSFSPAGSYAYELVYTVQTGSFSRESVARAQFDLVMNALSSEQADYLRIEKVGELYAVRVGKFAEYAGSERLFRAVEHYIPSSLIMKAYIKDERIKKIHRITMPEDGQDGEQSALEQAVEKKKPVIAGKDNENVKADPRNTEETLKLNAPPYLTRDLFSAGYLKHKYRGIPGEIGNSLKLKATIIDGLDPLAIIGDEVLGIGEFVNGLEVTDIKSNEVILSKGGNKYRLRMAGE